MCFAPRYINGTMARPCSPCRNTASFPATPCASNAAAPRATNPRVRTTRLIVVLLRALRSLRALRASLTLIPFMAGIAGLVDDFADGQNPGGILFLRRGDRGVRRIAERNGKLRPVAAIHGAVARQHQVG